VSAAATWFPGTLPAPITLSSPARPIRARFEELLAAVCAEHLIPRAELLGRGRRSDIVAARRDFCTRARAEGASWPVIGAFIDRDHTSVMALVKGKWRQVPT
jgi:chromosomal replication initiation ATPase DnaA